VCRIPFIFFTPKTWSLLERYEGIWGSGVVAPLIYNVGYRFRSASFRGHFTLQWLLIKWETG